MGKPMTHADLARDMAHIARLSTSALAYLSEGMWNSNFCAADCSAYALSVCDDLRQRIEQIETRIIPRTQDEE